MNNDELKSNGETNTEVKPAEDSMFATPVGSEPAAQAPETPAPEVAPAAPEVAPAVQEAAPAQPATETPAAPVAETPVESTPETPATPVETPAAPAAIPDVPVETPAVSAPDVPATENQEAKPEGENAPLFDEPPVPTLEEIIANPTNVSEINTAKRKGGEGVLIICVVVFAVFAFFMGDIIGFIEPLFKSTNPVIESNSTGDNVVQGYLKIDDGISEKTIEDLKIYKIIKNNKSEISFTYISNKKIKSIDDLLIYIEVYNSNKELLYKNHFAPHVSGETGNARIYSFPVNKDIYDEAYYIDLKIYTEEEINSKMSLVCTRTSSDENYTATSEITYNFVNNSLKTYEVNKSVTITNESPEGQQYINEMTTDNDVATKYGITTKYENNKLNYTVDLENISEEFIPQYPKDTTRVIIVKKESLKDWTCK